MNECQVIDARTTRRLSAVSHLDTALQVLMKAYDCARSLQRDVWQFAVEIGELTNAGVACCDLRRLIALGFVAHAMERIERRSGERKFQSVKGLTFDERSCFVLTAMGESHARQSPFTPPGYQSPPLNGRADSR